MYDLYFFVGVCYGFQVMRQNESPEVPFTLLMTRFKQGESLLGKIF